MNDKIKASPIKFVLALVLFVFFQLPLMIPFYILRSAWDDCWRVGQWLRPPRICDHGIDRNREACDDCNTREEHEFMSMLEGADVGVHTHAHMQCTGCGEVICVKDEHASIADGDACPVCHIATVNRVV